MNFYFCETCGKRITENDIEQGLGRNKKLKGVYCKECSVGVNTMELFAITDAQLKEADANQPEAPPAPPVQSRSSAVSIAPAPRTHTRDTAVVAQRKSRWSSHTVLAGTIVGVVLCGAVALFAFSPRPENTKALTQPVAQAPLPVSTLEKKIEAPVPAQPPPVSIEATPAPAAPKEVTIASPPAQVVPTPKADEASAGAEGYSFDFETDAGYDRFVKLFKPVLAVDADLKHELGKLIVHRTTVGAAHLIHLQTDTIKLGANFEIEFRANMKVGVTEAASAAKLVSGMNLCFMAPGEKPSKSDDDRTRFTLRIDSGGELFCRFLGPGNFHSGNKGMFAGMQSFGFHEGNCLPPKSKLKKPASADGFYTLKLTMHGNRVKANLNGTDVLDATLPDAASARIQNSPLTILFTEIGADIEVFRLSYKALPEAEK